MEEKGLKNKDLVGIIGTKGYVSALLNKRKGGEMSKFYLEDLERFAA